VFFSSDTANPDTYTHFFCDAQVYDTTMPQAPAIAGKTMVPGNGGLFACANECRPCRHPAPQRQPRGEAASSCAASRKSLSSGPGKCGMSSVNGGGGHGRFS
jgi:hypothetical protein